MPLGILYLSAYLKHKIREIHIVDDIFNIDRKRMHEILNKLIDSGMNIKIAFPNGLRGGILEVEDILLLKKAGAYMITLAVETASRRMQKIIKKNLNIGKVIKNIEYADKIGLLTKGYFMIGFPGETPEEIEETVSTAVNSRLHMVSFFNVVPSKCTGLFELASQSADYRIESCLMSYHAKNSYYRTATGYDLRKMQKSAYRRFNSVRRLIRLFIRVPRRFYLLYRYTINYTQLIIHS